MYRAAWSRFDNATSVTTPFGQTESATAAMTAPPGLPANSGSFIEVDVSADSPAHPTWAQPIKTYFRRTSDGWALVGLERMP
jgi:hypothetical protein